MPLRPDRPLPTARKVHPYAWLWESLEADATFVLRAMFGAKAVHLDGRMIFCFSAGEEPWRGMLVCTSREHHAALLAQFPDLAPHPVLPKWLYLPEAHPDFERTATRLVQLARQRDPRLGVETQTRQRRRARAGRRP